MRLPFITLGDAFLPAGAEDPKSVRRLRASILQSFFGMAFTIAFGCLYGLSGSPWSGVAVACIGVPVAFAPFALRRGVSTFVVGNVAIAVTYLATFVVVSRSGGITSPAMVWSFMPPLSTYVACGARSSVVWALLSSLQIAVFFAAELAGVTFSQDFGPGLLSILRVSSNLGIIFSTLMVLYVVESARLASERAIELANQTVERERILGDMHDGVGSQLLGLIVQARAGTVGTDRMVYALERCLDDVRLIVNSLDPVDRPLETALGELRSRIQPRCEAAGVELTWSCELGELPVWSPGATLQVLRAVQEALSNALRHAQARHIALVVSITDAASLSVEVRDDGLGFDPERPPRTGQGLKSLRARARKLGGELEISAASPGTRIVLRCPTAQPLQPS